MCHHCCHWSMCAIVVVIGLCVWLSSTWVWWVDCTNDLDCYRWQTNDDSFVRISLLEFYHRLASWWMLDESTGDDHWWPYHSSTKIPPNLESYSTECAMTDFDRERKNWWFPVYWRRVIFWYVSKSWKVAPLAACRTMKYDGNKITGGLWVVEGDSSNRFLGPGCHRWVSNLSYIWAGCGIVCSND